jgi:IclR family pca regulon transcriptional regulator
MTASAQPEPSGDFVQSLARGLAVIRAFDAEHPELTLSEVAARAELPRAAARRFLLTLEQLGYVRAAGRAFALTPRVLELGFSFLSGLSLPELAQPHLEKLSREIDESVSLAVRDDANVVYVARVPTRRIMSVSITIGTRFPAFVTSLGRVMLAHRPVEEQEAILRASALRPWTERTLIEIPALLSELARVGEQGWAVVDGELEEGLRSVAAPVHDRTGEVVAAVNVSMMSRSRSDQSVDDITTALLRTTRAIDDDLRRS